MYEVWIAQTGQLWAVFATRVKAEELANQLSIWGYEVRVTKQEVEQIAM